MVHQLHDDDFALLATSSVGAETLDLPFVAVPPSQAASPLFVVTSPPNPIPSPRSCIAL